MAPMVLAHAEAGEAVLERVALTAAETRPPALEELGDLERMWAEAAWAYFVKNTSPATGLVPARTGSAFASAWSMGDQVAALVLARRLEILEPLEFDRRFSTLLGFLNSLPLTFNQLPNRLYSIETGEMIGADFQPGVSGWSAVDVGRLLIWLRIAGTTYPEYERYIRNAVSRLSVCNVAENGHLLGAQPSEAGPTFAPESARGYDAYAAQGFRAWGLELPTPAEVAWSFEIDLYGERFPLYDDPALHAPVMTAAPAYLGLEFGFDPIAADPGEELFAGGRTAEDLLQTIHAVQEARFQETGVHTARADYRRASEPFTVYDTILATGYPWSTADPAGKAFPNLALVSTRAAFTLTAFFDSDYAASVFEVIRPLYDDAAGWGEGRYEVSGAHEQTRTSTTNAFILEALAYQQFGALFPDEARPQELKIPAQVGRGICRLPVALDQER